MKKLLAFCFLLLASGASAQTSPMGACPFAPSALRAAYKDTLTTVSNTAVGFTSSVWKPTDGHPQAVCALVAINTSGVSFWADGSTPTAGNGILIPALGSFWIGVNNMSLFLMIRSTAADAAVAIQFFVPAP